MEAMTSAASVGFKFECHCGAISLAGSWAATEGLPIETALRHGRADRYSTGGLAVAYVMLREGPPRGRWNGLRAARGGEEGVVVRLFCGTCGCHCFMSRRRRTAESGTTGSDGERDEWWVAAGMIVFDDEDDAMSSSGGGGERNTIRVTGHVGVEETGDGGLALLMPRIGGRDVPIIVGDAAAAASDTAMSKMRGAFLSSALSRPAEDECLDVRCACGGVSLKIKRADFASSLSTTTATGPASAAAPFAAGRHADQAADPTRYKTYMCACRSCRLTTGASSLVPWALVPTENVLGGSSMEPVVVGDASGSKTDGDDDDCGLLVRYASSAGVIRSFCGGCGATVYYWNGERPGEVDVAVGVMRDTSGGSMARRWLDWEWGRCSFGEESCDGEVLGAWRGSGEVVARGLAS